MHSAPNDYISADQFNRASSVEFLMRPLADVMADKSVTEVCVNRPGEVFVERAGLWERSVVPDLTFVHLKSLATAIAKFTSEEISESKPILSATLPGGERVQVILPPACEHETVSVTIRKPSFVVRTIEDYGRQGFFDRVSPIAGGISDGDAELLKLKEDRDYLQFFRRAVQLEKVIVVAGATGSGKTTFMRALTELIGRFERLITIQDVPELFLPNHPNHVHLYYPSEAKEEDNVVVTAASLLRSCMRMKPNRILLAEVRGSETFDFLNLAASGHGGSITSCHAGSVALTFERLALMVLQNRQGRTLPYEVIRRLLYMVIDVVVHVHNDATSVDGRHITELWFDPTSKKVFKQEA